MTMSLPVPTESRHSADTVAIERLPVAALGFPELDSDPAWRLAAAFLLGYRGHTRRAYFADIRAWYGWCASMNLPPLSARRHHVDRWIAEQLEGAPPTERDAGRVDWPAALRS